MSDSESKAVRYLFKADDAARLFSSHLVRSSDEGPNVTNGPENASGVECLKILQGPVRGLLHA